MPARAAGGGRKASACTPLEGLLLQIVNPKVLFYGLTLMSSFVVPWSDAPSLLLVVSALAGVLAFSSQFLWGVFGTLFQRYFSRYETEVNLLTALLLVYCAWTISGLSLPLP